MTVVSLWDSLFWAWQEEAVRRIQTRAPLDKVMAGKRGSLLGSVWPGLEGSTWRFYLVFRAAGFYCVTKLFLRVFFHVVLSAVVRPKFLALQGKETFTTQGGKGLAICWSYGSVLEQGGYKRVCTPNRDLW